MTSQPPYGYRLSNNGNGVKLIVNEAEAQVIQMVFDWYVNERMTARGIADQLTQMRIPKPRSKQHLQWTHSTVRNILKNEAYIGRWYYCKDKVINGKRVAQPVESRIMVEVPCVVSPGLFEAAQRQNGANKERAHNRPKQPYLMSGRVTCGACHYAYTGSERRYSRRGGRQVIYLYYQHSDDHYAAGELTCKAYFRADQVDAVVWDWIRSILADPERLDVGFRDYQATSDQDNEPIRARLAVVESLVAENWKKLEKLLDDYLEEDDFLKEMLVDRKARLETTIDALEKERAGLVARLEAQTLTEEQLRSLQEFAAKVGEHIEYDNFQMRRGVIEALDVRATLVVEDGKKVAYPRCRLPLPDNDKALAVKDSITAPCAPPSTTPGRAP